MNIGIDGGALSISDDRLKVGVYRIASNLVQLLPALHAENNYRIYGFGRGEKSYGHQSKTVAQHIRLPRVGFHKIWQSVEMSKHPVDVYLGISQALPITLYDVKKIGFIYDVGFLDHPDYYRESYYALRANTESVIKRAHHIITISHASKNRIQELYHVPHEKMSVCYLGIEAVFQPEGAIHVRENPYFLFVGALKPGKNVPMMLRAFAEFLRVSKKPVDLVLAGSDYWLDPAISATINALGIRHRIVQVGFLDDETLATYYRGAVALLTVSKIEGFGLPAVEAMKSGTPVIASSIGSYPEVVGEAGLLVHPDNENELVQALISISKHKGFRDTLKKKGLERVRAFEWKNFAHSVTKVIQEVSAQ